MKRLLVPIVPVLFVLACKGGSSTTPSTGGVTGVSLTGFVTGANIGPIPGPPGPGPVPDPVPVPVPVPVPGPPVPVEGAVIKILDGPNAGIFAASDSSGAYIMTNLIGGNATVSATSTIFEELRASVTINGTNSQNFNFPTPACFTNKTGRIAFRNASPRVNEDFRWDGVVLATLTPGQTSDPFVTAAGPHTLQVMAAGKTTLACNTSTPSIVQCSKDNLFTCTGP